ncbi:MAG: hypothetical protein OXP75_06790 [Rhodospirillales bacterium]|nr:hypothetical protein [Rhodospirillales bacterium]
MTAQLPESPADVKAAWSKGGRHVWTGPVPAPKETEFITIVGQEPDSGQYRVIFHERIEGIFATEHFVLQPEPLA